MIFDRIMLPAQGRSEDYKFAQTGSATLVASVGGADGGTSTPSWLENVIKLDPESGFLSVDNWHVKGDLIIEGQVNQWLAQQLVVDDARIQVNRKQDGATVDSGLVIFDKDSSTEVSSLVFDVNGIWKAGGERLFTEAYNPKLGGYPAADYPRKAENAVITGAWSIYRAGADTTLLRFGTERPWQFRQVREGASAGLSLVSEAGSKSFDIRNTQGVRAADFFVGETSSRVLLVPDGGNVGIGLDTTPTERLHVAGNGLFTGNLSAPTFVSGFAGSGWRLEAGEENHLTLDRLTVRGRMDVYELVVNQIRGTNGALWVSDSAKVSSVSGNRLTIDTGGDTSFVPFVVNDLLRCQRWNGNNVKYYVVRVTAVGSNYIDVTLVAGSSPREAGDHLVRMGNTEDTDRQGALYLTSSDNNAPYMDVLDGVNSASFAGKTKVRIGRLDGITDPDLGMLTGYGLYTENGYFKGKVQVTGGNAATKADVDAVQVGGRNHIPNSSLRGMGHNLSGNLIRVNDPDGVMLTRSNTTDPSRHFCSSYFVSNFALGDQITLSAWIRLESGIIPASSTMFVRFFNSSGGNVQDVITLHISHISGDWVRVTGTGTITHSAIDFSRNIQVAIAIPVPTAPVTIQTREWKLELGNRATDWTPAPEDVPSALDYLATAIQDGSTEIEGGLINTNVLMVKDTNGEVSGGISGLASDNVGFWTGGTYQAAVDNNANVIFRKDGSFSLAGGKISGTSAGELSVDGGVVTGIIESSNYDGTVGSRFDLHNGHLLIGDAIRMSGDMSEIHVKNRDTGLDSFKIGDFPLTPTNFAGAGVDVLLSSSSVSTSPASGSYQLNRTVYLSSAGALMTSTTYISNSLIVGGTYNFNTYLKISLSKFQQVTTLPFILTEKFARIGGNGIKVQLKNYNTVVWEQNIFTIPADGIIPLSISTSFQAVSPSLQLIITIDGEYQYQEPYGSETRLYNTAASIARFNSSSRLVLQALLARMEFSTKGMQAVFSNTNYFRCDNTAIEGRGIQTFISPNGTYRLRISNDGIEKSTNGGTTWTSI